MKHRIANLAPVSFDLKEVRCLFCSNLELLAVSAGVRTLRFLAKVCPGPVVLPEGEAGGWVEGVVMSKDGSVSV